MQRTFKHLIFSAISSLLLFNLGCQTRPEIKSLSDWPAGTSPEEIGRLAAENFVARPLDFEIHPNRKYVIYPEVCSWYGSLKVAKLTGNKDLQSRLIHKFDPLLGPEARRISPNDHVDYRVFGIVPLEIFLETHDDRYLAIGKSLADKQWKKPTPDGLTHEARYWVDDIYMISAVQVQAYRATHDPVYLDHAALTVATYLDKLQQPNGLFFHAADSRFFWGRGNGWFAAGMAELLSELPANHPQHERIMRGYKTMMASLLKFQSDQGLWRQLIDRPESFLETSGSGMFAFAMITGVKHGWLDAATYGPAARKAWLGLVSRLDEKGNIKDVCIGTNKAAQEVGADPETQLKFYLNRSRRTGDLHGQAALLWTASALLR